jgi:O-succinylbenzoic acid--CoA ligase
MTSRPTVLPDWLASRAAGTPERVALVVGARTWTFAELDAEVTSTARRLAALGARAGDRIATLLHNGAAAAMLPHVALRLGATLVPLNVRLSDVELAWQLVDAMPRLLVAEERTAAQAERTGHAHRGLITVRVDRDGVLAGDPHAGVHHVADLPMRLAHDADAILAIIYTSGTTGQPKGAMLTVGNFWWSAIGSALNLGTHADDRWLACLPLFHVGGLSIVVRAAIYGIAAVVLDGFDVAAVHAAIDDDRVTIVSVVAVMLQRMLDARGDQPYPSSLRCVLLGGGPAPRPLLERCVLAQVPVVQTYGLTETCSQVATLAPEEARRRPGSAGKALYPNVLRIAAPSGSEARDGDVGEILVRGPIVMQGYAGQPAATARTIVDGWLRTGDLGRIDADGYLYVIDRRDDLIVTGGENVYPAEVESVLLSHRSIVEAAVVGMADATWGQRVVAVVRLDGLPATDVDATALLALCRSRLAGYKVPREIRLVTEPLPRTASGKLRRAALRDLVATTG